MIVKGQNGLRKKKNACYHGACNAHISFISDYFFNSDYLVNWFGYAWSSSIVSCITMIFLKLQILEKLTMLIRQIASQDGMPAALSECDQLSW